MAGLIPFNQKNNNFVNEDTEDFNNTLDDFFIEGWIAGHNLPKFTFKIDIRDINDVYIVEAEVPGTKKEEIEISVDDEILIISIHRKEDVDREHKGYIHKERRTGSMSRGVRLSRSDPDGIKTALQDGVLTIIVPKKDKKEAFRKITVD